MAFFNGQIIENVYVKYPYNFGKFKKVCCLFKDLYSLKQSPYMWYKVIYNFLISLGF